MRKFFYNMSSGNPKVLVMPCLAAFVNGLCKIIPAALMFIVFDIVYSHFANPETPMDISGLWLVSVILIVWIVVLFLTFSFEYGRSITASYEVSANGRTALAEHLRKLSLGFLGSRDPGDLTTMMLGDYAQVEETNAHQLPQLVGAVTFPFLAFVSLLFFNWRMALAMFIVMPIALIIMWSSAKLQRRMGERHIRAKVDSTSRLQEYLLGMKEIKSHNMGGERFERLREAFHRLMRESIRMEGLFGSVVMLAIAVLRSGLTVMIFVGAYLLVDGELSLPIFLVFLLLGTRIFDPMTTVLTNYASIRYAALSAERIMDIRHEKTLPGNEDVPSGNSVRFEHVIFSYDEKIVLDNVSLSLSPQSITALVGPSGSGKSTVTRLIARFWDVQEGGILLDGVDIRKIDPEKLLSHISMVFQDVYLFKDTIRNNIAIGNPGAGQEEIEQAAQQARCHEFIMKLPKGYETLVGEGGCTLSGGERQRISIARALLKDAPIILLDEATASLDPENETQVQRAIGALVKNKTVVIIAHRLRTVVNADNIVVIEEGHIAEQGTHEELLKRGGLYERLWNLQQKSAGWSMKS